MKPAVEPPALTRVRALQSPHPDPPGAKADGVRSYKPRRGYALLELTVSTLLVVAALGIVAQTVVWVASQRHGAERRERAIQEAANLMERITARPWDELTPELARSQTLSAPTAGALVDGMLDVAIAPSPGDPPAKSITIRIRWGGRPGGQSAPVRLVAWVHRKEARP